MLANQNEGKSVLIFLGHLVVRQCTRPSRKSFVDVDLCENDVMACNLLVMFVVDDLLISEKVRTVWCRPL